MKANLLKLLVLLILAAGFTGGSVLKPVQRIDFEFLDIYGTVFGTIVDPETGTPVREEFKLTLYDSSRDSYPTNILRNETTDKNGRFQLRLYPYLYYLEISPVSKQSKYCKSLYPFKVNPAKRFFIKIEKGKITQFQARAKIGGKMKIVLTDLSNNPINPNEVFSQKFHITTYFSNDVKSRIDSGNDSLDDGILITKNIYPAKYSVRVRFEGLGYNEKIENNIVVEPGKTTDVSIKMDLNDMTGVEGIVTDANGTPLEGVEVYFTLKDGPDFIAHTATTNQSGHYKLRGMQNGDYYLSYSYSRKSKNSHLGFFDDRNIEIKSGVLLKFDIRLKETINQLENN